MAMTPPGPGGPSGGAPPGIGGPPPPGAPPVPMGPQIPPPNPFGGGGPPPQQAAPPASPYTDLTDKLPHHYQLLDVACSTIEQAINSGGFYKEPKALAGIRSIYSQLSQIVANRAREGQLGGSVPEGPATPPMSETDEPGDDDVADEEGADGQPE